VERITDQLWPGIGVIPTMATGATDGLYLRNAGIPVYGIAGQFYGDSNAHGMNERIPQQAFYDSLEFMTRLVKNLSRPVVN
jgi:acetylornithine deacetylase/succinyl-diaminopimelate desuccinylase-like protein